MTVEELGDGDLCLEAGFQLLAGGLEGTQYHFGAEGIAFQVQAWRIEQESHAGRQGLQLGVAVFMQRIGHIGQRNAFIHLVIADQRELQRQGTEGVRRRFLLCLAVCLFAEEGDEMFLESPLHGCPLDARLFAGIHQCALFVHVRGFPGQVEKVVFQLFEQRRQGTGQPG